jgi:hypothetical protein
MTDDGMLARNLLLLELQVGAGEAPQRERHPIHKHHALLVACRHHDTRGRLDFGDHCVASNVLKKYAGIWPSLAST